MPIQHTHLVEQFESYLAEEKYAQALPLFKNILLHDLLTLPHDLLGRVLSHVHILALNLEGEGADKQFYEEIRPILCRTSIETQIPFYQGASKTYIQSGKYLEALGHALQALWLAEQEGFSEFLPEVQSQLNEIDAHISQEQFIALCEKASHENLQILLEQITPLINKWLRIGQKEQIERLYKILEPLLKEWQSSANTRMHVTRQKSLEQFSEIINSLLHIVRYFEEHHQWQYALDVYYKMLSYVTHEAKSYDKTWIIEKIEKLNDYQQGNLTGFSVETSSEWLSWREELHNHRLELKKAIDSGKDVLEGQAQFSNNVKILLKTVVQSIVELLGESPCGFSLIGLGSMARGDMCPYSDVDIALLIEDEKLRDHQYFQSLICLLQLNVSLIGEPDGFWVDEGDIEYLTGDEKIQLNTPQGLLKHYHPKNVDLYQQPESHAIHSPTLIYANDTGGKLLDDYLDLVQEAFQGTDRETYGMPMPLSKVWALKHFALCKDTYIFDETKSAINLKEDFIRPLTLWCSDIGLYFGKNFKEGGILAILKELQKNIHQNFLNQIKEALSECQKARILTQLETRKQTDTILSPTTKQRSQFKTIHNCLIRAAFVISQFNHLPGVETICHPTVSYLEKHCLGNLPQDKNLPEPEEIMDYLVKSLLAQQVDFEAHREIYQDIDAERLRVRYIENLKAASIDFSTLANIPNPFGYRQSERLTYEDLMEKLKTVCQPASQTKVSLSWIDDSRKLHNQSLCQEAIEKLIEKDGQLQRHFENSRHRGAKLAVLLAAGRGLYFKAMPDQPTMDYATDILHRRIIGHGTAPSILAKITVDGLPLGEPLIYPVLISPDMGQQTLQTVLRAHGPTFEINHVNYTELVLVALLINSGDAAARNFVVHEGYNGITLICVDSEQQFVEPVVKEISFKGLNKVQFRNILFCLYQANKPLDVDTLKRFCEQKYLYNCISEWIKKAQAREEINLALFSGEEREALYTQDKEYKFTPNLLIREGVIGELLINLNYLQTHIKLLLQDNNPPSALDLLTSLNPRLGHYYKEAYKAHQNPEERFKAATGAPQKSMSSSLAVKASLGLVPNFKDIESQERYSLKEANKELHALLDFKPDFSKLIDKEGKPDINRQKLMLKSLALYPHMHLSLSHCEVLTDDLLKETLEKSKNLFELNIRACSHITEKSIVYLAQRHPGLHELYVSDAPGIRRIYNPTFLGKAPLSFPNLEVFHLSRCESLVTINIDAPKLKEENIKTSDCHKLQQPVRNHANVIKVTEKEFEIKLIKQNNFEHNLTLCGYYERHMAQLGEVLVGKSLPTTTVIGTPIDRITHVNRVGQKHLLNFASCGESERFVSLITRMHWSAAETHLFAFGYRNFASEEKIFRGYMDALQKYEKKIIVPIMIGVDLHQRNKNDWARIISFCKENDIVYRHLVDMSDVDFETQWVRNWLLAIVTHDHVWLRRLEVERRERFEQRFPDQKGIVSPIAIFNEISEKVIENEGTSNNNREITEENKSENQNISMLTKVTTLFNKKQQHDVGEVLPIQDDRVRKMSMLKIVTFGKHKNVLRFCRLDPDAKATKSAIGSDFLLREISINNQTVTLQFWSTAGQERFHSLGRSYSRGADAVLVITPFFYINEMTKYCDYAFKRIKDSELEIPCVVVGAQNKHAKRERTTSFEECKALVLEKGADAYYECSYKGDEFEEVMRATAKLALGCHEQKIEVDTSLKRWGKIV